MIALSQIHSVASSWWFNFGSHGDAILAWIASLPCDRNNRMNVFLGLDRGGIELRVRQVERLRGTTMASIAAEMVVLPAEKRGKDPTNLDLGYAS